MSEFHKPVCADCSIDMFPDRNGAWVIDMCMDPPEPYKVWAADRWACPVCNRKIMSGFSNHGVRREEDNFLELLNRALRGEYIFNFEKLHHIQKYGHKLIPNMTAVIYQKPMTGEDAEGRATLVEPVPGQRDRDVQRWMVNFTGDEMNYERMINLENAELGWGK